MSFRPKSQAPRGYVPGIGRGAAGFTTRSDIGPAGSTGESHGSRSSGARFGQAPRGYVPGAGRGAGSSSREEGPTGGYDAFEGYQSNKAAEASTPYDEDDQEADDIYAAIDERMRSKRKRAENEKNQESEQTARQRIGAQFRDLKQKLSEVTEDQWMAIPDVGDYSLKYKQKRREDTFTPLSDTLLETRMNANQDATASNKALAGTLTDQSTTSGFQSVVTNMSGLAEARGTVLGMSLDRMSADNTAAAAASAGSSSSSTPGGHTTVDPKGYLTSLSNIKVATTAEVGDIHKARLLLKSVRDTNPHHGPGWIASARVEEAAGKLLQARKLIRLGCETCPKNEDVWLEAARLHKPPVAKSILATAARNIPTSTKIFLKAADLEPHEADKKAVLRKALEANPTSVTLWKAAIELEEADDARILLAVAVEKVPHSVEMWLALARLETYENARKVLNQARKALPVERSIWIAAAKLEESQNHDSVVEKIIDKAVKSLAKHDAVVKRDQWLQEAEHAESAGAPLTSAAIVQHTVGLGVDPEDRQRTWSEDAKGSLSRGAVATARSIVSHALAAFPTKRSLWMQAVDLERKHGTPASLDDVLAEASRRLPKVEIFWLFRAKEQWLGGSIHKSREILTEAFAANPNSEAVWLAASKLEWETGEIDRARVLLQRARERAPTDRVFMKSVLLEREEKKYDDALGLIEEGISQYPKFAKFYMMAGQIYSDDLEKTKPHLDKARKYYQKGLQNCPTSVVLWMLASRLEEKAHTFASAGGTSKVNAGVTKARSLLELARLKNQKNPELWLEAIRLERRASNEKLAQALMARALQECPSSGRLLAENIATAPRVEQKSKSADAIKRCPEDPYVIAAVASLFASERKKEKARKWFDKTVALDPDIGDSWAKYYAFELEHGTKEQQEAIKQRCVKAEPKHGEIWNSVAKDMANRRKTIEENLVLVAEAVRSDKRSVK